jgi:Coenzyme PQQ synthesis protein D (PqqD)
MAQEVNGETVLLDLKSENYFGLNDVGTRIWQLLAEGQDLRSVKNRLLTEFEVEEQTLLADMALLLTEMVDQGIIELGAID